MKPIHEGLTFDDVLLVPKRSAISSRRDADISTELTAGIKLNIPFIAANMDTVTESRMAIAMARSGGIGFIHRFLPLEIQAEEVTRVKRAENYVVENPYTLTPETTLGELKKISREKGVPTFLIANAAGKLLGIVTKRDYIFERDDKKILRDIMTPRERLVVGSASTTLDNAAAIFEKKKLEKLPLVDAADKIVGLVTSKDIQFRMNPLAVRDAKGRLLVGAAIGVKGDYLERAAALVAAGVDALVVDVAHGHLEIALATVAKIKNLYPDVRLVAGNIATEEGAHDLAASGADAVKVGVGPGSICKTRLVAGAGVPQLTAIMDAVRGAGNIPIIADGGVGSSADAVKALAAGASSVMCGSLFAGTDEAPGEVITWNDRRVKFSRGMASMSAHLKRNGNSTPGTTAGDDDISEFVSEGADNATVPYRGNIASVLAQLTGGIRSGMSYCGARTIPELWKKAEFIKMTEAGHHESGIHGVEL